MKLFRSTSAAVSIALLLNHGGAFAGEAVTASVDQARKVVVMKAGTEPFLELIYEGQPKPVIFPVLGPGGVPMVRQWPMLPAAPGEETDHPHHKGIWFTHGLVNGTDFWLEGPTAGKIVVTGVPEVSHRESTATISTRESWQKADGAPVLESTTTLTGGTEGTDRWLDYTITLSATQGEVLFGDTKEGTMGLRLNPVFNLKGKAAKGQVVTSDGKTGAAAWGTKAAWVDYSAPLEGRILGVACFDHPSNLRHPTTWHARDYGLFAANPFGLHDFQKKPRGAGDHTLKKGETITFRYRWLFHAGDTATAKVADRWKEWAARP